MPNFKKTAWPWIAISMGIVMVDQYTKYLVMQHLSAASNISVFPFLNIILSFNAGASFGFLGGQNGWQIYFLSGISSIVSLILMTWLLYLPRRDWQTAVPICLVLGGAIGNLLDRVRLGYVIDFLDFHVRGWHFATFNIADSAVSIGAVWLVYGLIAEWMRG